MTGRGAERSGPGRNAAPSGGTQRPGAERRALGRRSAAYRARYVRQAVGIVGLATWMNTCGLGVRGSLVSFIPA